jgi:hypothetical protein
MFRDCCGLAQDLAPPAVLASVLVDGGIVVAATILATSRVLVPRRVAAALGLLLVPVGLGVLLVHDMTYAPVVPRATESMVCRTNGDGVTVCIWPEQRDRASQLDAIVLRVRAGWRDAGIHPPSLFTEADQSVAPSDALVFQLSPSWSSKDEVIGALAAGMLPSQPECSAGATGFIAFEDLEAWYAAAGGMTSESLRDRYRFAMEPYLPPLTVVTQLQAATLETRRSWVQRAEKVTQACDDWSPDLIAVHP